jgi:alpha-ketoglutarate-dependent taurine dioxygenase
MTLESDPAMPGGLMTSGCFIESSQDDHVEMRAALLARGAVLPEPEVAAVTGSSLAAVGDGILEQLSSGGLAVAQLDTLPDDEEFLEFGARLGRPMPELDPTVQPFVEHGVLLNLRTAHGRFALPELQPFSTDPLTLHSESSGRPLAEQPRYIVLLCCDPGPDPAATQTALVPMAAVDRKLDDADRHLLRHLRYATDSGVPCIARNQAGRTAFSFRDFAGSALRWTADVDVDPDEFNAAVRRLLRAMYEPAGSTGVHWRPRMLVVIDNSSFFHGRTAGPVEPSAHQRHLRRLRITAA